MSLPLFVFVSEDVTLVCVPSLISFVCTLFCECVYVLVCASSFETCVFVWLFILLVMCVSPSLPFVTNCGLTWKTFLLVA